MLEQRYSDNEPSQRDIPSFIEPLPPLIQNHFMRPRPQKGINLLEQFDEDLEAEEPELVQVYLRMKPCNVQNNLYEVRSDKCLVTSLDTTTAGHGRRTQHNVSRMYTFSRIFGPDCSQKEIFDQVVKENLKKLPEGHSFTLLTYGASGSGKTYTLMGTVTSPGLVPRALEYVFKVVDAAQMPTYKPSDTGADQLSYGAQDYELQWVKRLRQVSAPLRDKYRRMSVQLHNDMTTSNVDLANRTKYYVWVSFVEIYNEAIYDLLAPPEKRTKLRIREDTSGNVYVKGVSQAFVRSGAEAYDVMVAGRHNLTVAATGVHAQSSRSHCIFTITMLTEQEGELRASHIRLCDLAGCERQRAARTAGARLQESRAINTSLHVLERCLHTLRRKQRLHGPALVPYRESKLTRLLGSGLSGSRGEGVSMVVTLNPEPTFAHETKHVLSLAAVAQDIQINNTMYASTLETINDTQDTTFATSAEVMKLRSDNERLHFELVQAQARNKELLASMEETQLQNANQIQEYVAEAKALTTQFYEAEINALKTEMEELKEEYENMLLNQATTNDAGSPSKLSQAKVSQLMTEIAVLEEQLVEEKLARARAEKEVQHLRTCIEERDEKAFTEVVEKEIIITDSDNESDNDPFNESLEPVFKKEQEQIKSHFDSRIEMKTNDTSEHTLHDENNKENDTLNDHSNDTLKDDSVRSKNESLKMKENKRGQESIDDFSLAQDNEVGYDISKNMKESFKDKDRSVNEDVFYEATKVQDEIKEHKQAKISRETYFVSDKPTVATENLAPRGTYFVDAPLISKENAPKPIKQMPESFVNKIIKSLKTNESSDSSLSQFEQLEMAANSSDFNTTNNTNKSQDFANMKVLKKRNYFYDNNETINEIENSNQVHTKYGETNIFATTKKQEFDDKTNPKVNLTHKAKMQEQTLYFDELKLDADEVLISSSSNTEKRTNIDTTNPVEPNNKQISVPSSTKNDSNDTKPTNDNKDIEIKDPNKPKNKILHIDKYDDRSPSIVKEEIPIDYKPSTIKKLLGESSNENTVKKALKKQDSLDLFESPKINRDIIEKIDSIKDKGDKTPAKSKELTKIAEVSKSIEILEITKVDNSSKENVKNTETASLDSTEKENNTINEFENICKDLSNVRVTEFEILANEVSTSDMKDHNIQEPKAELDNKSNANDLQNNDESKNYLSDNKSKNDETKTEEQKLDETKLYNLRKPKICESKTTTKRSLRLRRRNIDEENDEKFKDLINLKNEFSDVTMGVPAVQKKVNDIPSPEKLPGEEENLPPLMGIQSCPSKSVTRSRRKLFTPRAEPLDESDNQAGDSNERLYVPRPSYHRARARRKL